VRDLLSSSLPWRFKMKKLVVFLAPFAAMAAHAQIVPMGPFTGAHSEGFESGSAWMFTPQQSGFNGTATFKSVSGGGSLHTTNGWTYYTTVMKRSGDRLMGTIGDSYTIEFQGAVNQFGGYFGSNFHTPNGTITFFDASGAVIGSPTTLLAPQGTWEWNGFSSTVGIKKIRIDGIQGNNGAIMADDLQVQAVPEPATLSAVGLGAAAMLRRRKKK
jgi:hypothetical protein